MPVPDAQASGTVGPLAGRLLPVTFLPPGKIEQPFIKTINQGNCTFPIVVTQANNQLQQLVAR